MFKIRLNHVQISSILIAILPILNIYKVGTLPVSFGEAALIFIILLSLLLNPIKKLKVSNIHFILFFIIFFIISILSGTLRGQGEWSDFVPRWLKIVIWYYIIDLLSEKQFDINTIQKWNLFAGVCASFLLLIQSILANAYSLLLFPYLHFLPMYSSRDVDALFLAQIRAIRYGTFRPSAVFSEPAHFAQFTALPLVIVLFSSEEIINKNKKWLFSILLTAGIFLSGSANGIFLAIMLWIIWAFDYSRGNLKLNKYIILIFAIVVGVSFILSTGFLESALARLGTVSSDRATTGTQRLLQGFAVFERLSFSEKIFGIGFGNVSTYLIENNIVTAYLKDLGNEYMNGFSTVLVSGGIVGFLFYFIIWCRMFFKNKDIMSRAAFLVISALFCSSALFYSCSTVMYLVFIRCPKSNMVTESVVLQNSLSNEYQVSLGK